MRPQKIQDDGIDLTGDHPLKLTDNWDKKYTPLLIKAIRTFNFSGHDVKNLIQDTYTKAIIHIKKGRTVRTPKAWLKKTLINLAKNKKNRDNKLVFLTNLRPIDRLTGAARFSMPTPQEQLEAYRSLISSAPAEHMAILYAILFEERKRKDVASELGISLHKLAYRKKKALEYIRRIIGKKP